MAKTKQKATKVLIPQSRQAAEQFITSIHGAQLELDRIAAELKGETAALKERAEEMAAQHKALISERTKGLELWAAANRQELTRGFKTKTVALATGKISWRHRPKSVGLRNVENVLKFLKLHATTQNMQRFIRTKQEINKEALLAEPETAAMIPGVSIRSEGEDFTVEPAGIKLEDVA